MVPRSKAPEYALTLRWLDDGFDITAYKLATILGVDVRNAREYLKMAKREGKAHIVGWERHGQFGNGPPVPIFNGGAGDDALRPLPMTSAEGKRKQRANPLRKIERRWRSNERPTTDQ